MESRLETGTLSCVVAGYKRIYQFWDVEGYESSLLLDLRHLEWADEWISQFS